MILIQAIRDLAALYPDAEYVAYREDPDDPDEPVQCRYDRGEVVNGPPRCEGCLLGQALESLSPGVTREAPWTYRPSYEMALEVCEANAVQELDWLQACQAAQDGGHTWGEAVTLADAKIGRLGVETAIPPTHPTDGTYLLTVFGTGATVLGDRPLEYGNAYISVYPVLVSGKPVGQLLKGQRCKVRYGLHPNIPGEYWIERVT